MHSTDLGHIYSFISGGCPSLGMGPECRAWLSPALPCPGHVPESSTESAAVMTCKHTNTNSKVVIIYLQETTQGERICVCSQELSAVHAAARQCNAFSAPKAVLGEGFCHKVQLALGHRSMGNIRYSAMYNSLKCYYTPLNILLSHSLSCDSVLPMEQKDNFTTGFTHLLCIYS